MPAPKWALLKATESVEVNAYSCEVESSIQYIHTLYACVSVDLMIEISSNKFVNAWLQLKREHINPTLYLTLSGVS